MEQIGKNTTRDYANGRNANEEDDDDDNDDEEDVLGFFKQQMKQQPHSPPHSPSLPPSSPSRPKSVSFSTDIEQPHEVKEEEEENNGNISNGALPSLRLQSILESRQHCQRLSTTIPILTVFGGTTNTLSSSSVLFSPTACSGSPVSCTDSNSISSSHGGSPTASNITSNNNTSQRVEAFCDYVAAYKDYIKDRGSAYKAKHRQEAQHLLAVSKAM